MVLAHRRWLHKNGRFFSAAFGIPLKTKCQPYGVISCKLCKDKDFFCFSGLKNKKFKKYLKILRCDMEGM